MTEICPISGLPKITNPAWKRIQLDTEMWFEYYFLGDSIMVQRAFGRITANCIRKTLEVESALINENLDQTRTCIYLVDVSGVTHLEPAGRAAHRDELIRKRTTFSAVVYFGASLLMRVSIYAARKIHLVERMVEVVDKENDAIRLALSLIQTQDLTLSINLLGKDGLSQAPQISLKDANGSAEVRYIGGAILFLTPRGSIGPELMGELIKSLIDDSGFRLGKPRALLILIDFAGIDSISGTTRNLFLEMFIRLHQLVPVVASVNINASPSWLAVIQLSRFRIPFKVVVVKKGHDLPSELRKVIEKHAKSSTGKSVKSNPPKDTAHANLLTYLAEVSWDIPGDLHPPQNVTKDESILAIFEALAVIKRDFDEVIQSRAVMEGDLRRLATESLAATKAKTQFLANMSHEIRTPLNGVIGMTDLLLTSPLDHEQLQWAQTIRQSGVHLKDLVSSILDISKIEAGEIKLESISFKVRELLERCNDSWHFEAVAKGLTFVLDIHSDVPQWVVGDPGRLRQIVLNLVGNAMKFTHQGGVTLRVIVEATSSEGCVLHFLIKDSGIGIPLDRQHLLFQNFQQIDSSTTRFYGGTGLGLYLSREFVTSMGGKIGMRSESGIGSEFWFSLPFAIALHKPTSTFQIIRSINSQESDSIKSTAVPKESSIPVPVSFTPPELPLLLVEDTLVNRKVALAMLRKLGCQVEVAEDGAEAVRILGAGKFSMVIMDCHMPVMDGYEATRRIRAGDAADIHRSIPIIAMTASALAGDREKCLEAGMVDYMSKPITLQGLSEVLARNQPNALRA